MNGSNSPYDDPAALQRETTRYMYNWPAAAIVRAATPNPMLGVPVLSDELDVLRQLPSTVVDSTRLSRLIWTIDYYVARERLAAAGAVDPNAVAKATALRELLNYAHPASDVRARAGAELTALLAAVEEGRRDTARLDWLEGEFERERAAFNDLRPMPRSLFRKNMVITRAAIDAARTPDPATTGERDHG